MKFSGGTKEFEKIKKKCLEEGVLYEDSSFPGDKTEEGVEWKRASELSTDPQFVIDGITRFDVNQGSLGDCWFLAAIGSMTLKHDLFNIVVPPENNSFAKGDYCGAFHFRFWQYGKWVDMIIDDRLPTRGGSLIYLTSDHENEFWPALFEKAYAKLHGSYESISGGWPHESFVDFTGGITETFRVKSEKHPNLFSIMERSFQKGSLLAVGILTSGNHEKGLPGGHAYSITCVATLEDLEGGGSAQLIRVRNPWGNATEWKGDWNDQSEKWKQVSDDKKKELGVTADADGEFWMSFVDFKTHTDILDICHLSADGVDEEEEKLWKLNAFEGSWVNGATAGGNLDNKESFASNPQYVVHLQEAPDVGNDGKCTMLISLSQKHRRAQGKHSLTIGFYVFALPNADSQPKPLPSQFFTVNEASHEADFTYMREVTSRVELSPGHYVIIPCTHAPNEEGEFLIRVFTESKVVMSLNDSPVGLLNVVECEDDDHDDGTEFTWEMFAVKCGNGMKWDMLRDILDGWVQKKQPNFKGFSRDTIKSLVALVDQKKTGRLSYHQFRGVWKALCQWQRAFLLHDLDSSGSLHPFELRPALKSAGYQVNNDILQGLVLRFGDNDGGVLFEDFVACVVRLRGMIANWWAQVYDKSNSSGILQDIVDLLKDSSKDELTAKFTLEEWLAKTIYS